MITYSFSNTLFALPSTKRCSHCWVRYASRGPTASGLYRSRPLIIWFISAGRSCGSSWLLMVGNLGGEGILGWWEREEKSLGDEVG